MHYIGMSSVELCRPVHTLPCVAGGLIVSVVLSVLAIRLP
jgi:NO-binding membrane sensor protein with MHYT domain